MPGDVFFYLKMHQNVRTRRRSLQHRSPVPLDGLSGTDKERKKETTGRGRKGEWKRRKGNGKGKGEGKRGESLNPIVKSCVGFPEVASEDRKNHLGLYNAHEMRGFETSHV